MLPPDAFLTELYVLIDDWDKAQPPDLIRPGPVPQLARSEVVALALFSQLAQFRSERRFWSYADRHLRPLFPALPSREQFGHALRRQQQTLERLAVALGESLAPPACPYEILDATGIETRDPRRRGRGWLPGDAVKGKCTRVGWYVGVRLLLCVTPEGAVTGFGMGSGNLNDRHLAETFLANRSHPDPGLASTGHACAPGYIADGGFTGTHWEQRWREAYGANVVCPPQLNHARIWSPAFRRHFASLRQIVETTTEKLLGLFRMATDRWHTQIGLLAHTAAKIAAFNAAMLINKRYDRPLLAMADLVDW